MVTVRRLLGGVAAALALAGLLTLVPASPAAAHTRAAAASQWDSRITSTPEVPGMRWRTYAGGDLIELTLERPLTVIVSGYEGEPYLRIDPDGVHTNLNSPATYLNAERYGDVALPPRADASAAPQWRRVSHRPTYAWHDHRVHWMAPTPPPAVRSAPGDTRRVQSWAVELQVDGRPAHLAGELWWEPGPSALRWLALGVLLSAPAAVGLTLARNGPRSRRAAARDDLRRRLRPAAAVVGAVAALNLLHLVDEVAAWPAPTLDVLFGVLHTALFVGTGLIGAGIAWRATQGPHLSLGVASGAVLFHQGLLQWRLLGSSQLPTVWPPPLLRLAVALSVAQAIWVAVVVAVSLRAGGEDVPAAEPPAPAAELPARAPAESSRDDVPLARSKP